LGVSQRKIKIGGLVASISGSTEAAFNQSLNNISKRIGEATKSGNKDFDKLGIKVIDAAGKTKTAFDVMEELRGKFSDISREKQVGYAETLGFHESLIQMLNRDEKEMKALEVKFGNLFLLSTDQIASFESYADSLGTMRVGFSSITQQMALAFLPTFRAISEAVTVWLLEALPKIQKFFVSFGDSLDSIRKNITKFIDSEAFQSLKRMGIIIVGLGIGIPVLLKLGSAIKAISVLGLVLSISKLTTAMKLFVTATLPALIIPALIVGGIVLLALAIEDLWVGLKGGDSLFFKLGRAALDMNDKVRNVLEDMVARISDEFLKIKNSVTNYLEDMVSKISAKFLKIKNSMIDMLMAPIKLLKEFMALLADNSPVDLLKKVASGVGDLFNSGTVAQEVSENNNLPIGSGVYMRETAARAVQSSTTNKTTSNNKSTNIGSITLVSSEGNFDLQDVINQSNFMVSGG
jgi:hypothetical protein